MVAPTRGVCTAHGTGRTAKFVKRYARLADTLRDAAREYGDEVRSRAFPGPDHSF